MKKSMIIGLALALCAVMVFAACDSGQGAGVMATEQPAALETPEATEQPSDETPGTGTAMAAPTQSTQVTMQAAGNESTLTVSTTETVKVAPDIAYVTLGVRTQGASAEDAQQQNAQAAETFLAAIRASGVADEDVETSYVNLYQDYEDSSIYIMENDFRVTIRDIDNVGSVIDVAVRAGANSSYSLSFGIEDRDSVYVEALSRAMRSVEAKAKTVAEAGGYSIVRSLSIQESGSSSYGDEMAMNYAASAADMEVAAATPISPGEIEVSATMTGTYVIE